MGAPPLLQPMFFSYTYRITELQYSYDCATLKEA